MKLAKNLAKNHILKSNKVEKASKFRRIQSNWD